MGLDVVLADLEADGYTCGAVVVPAGAVNALHRRDRVWIMAHTECGEWPRPSRDGWSESPDGGDVGDANVARLEGRLVGGERSGERLAGTPGGESVERAGGEAARPMDAGIDGLPAGLVRRPAAGPDGIRDRWADGSWEDGLPRVVTSEPDRKHKLMAAGNAIVPLVAYELLRVMIGDAA